ncbi:MAG: hypothetical protein DDT26_00292 [Dehalococcoidia bacterium]|nr:hypothetical protein [Chloroflexota bacterium]
MDSKRLATLKALTAHLEAEVSVANGYDLDLAGAVFRGRAVFDEADPVPCVSILDNITPDRFSERAGNNDGEQGDAYSRWVVLVQGWSTDDKKNPTDPAEQLMAAVKKAISVVDSDPHPMTGAAAHPNYLLGGLINGVEIEPGTVRPPDQNSSKAYFWMRVILKFTENVRDPFDHR